MPINKIVTGTNEGSINNKKGAATCPKPIPNALCIIAAIKMIKVASAYVSKPKPVGMKSGIIY
jgi:hypothetical protein